MNDCRCFWRPKEPDPLELELQKVESHPSWCWELESVFVENRTYSTTEPSIRPNIVFTKSSSLWHFVMSAMLRHSSIEATSASSVMVSLGSKTRGQTTLSSCSSHIPHGFPQEEAWASPPAANRRPWACRPHPFPSWLLYLQEHSTPCHLLPHFWSFPQIWQACYYLSSLNLDVFHPYQPFDSFRKRCCTFSLQPHSASWPTAGLVTCGFLQRQETTRLNFAHAPLFIKLKGIVLRYEYTTHLYLR